MDRKDRKFGLDIKCIRHNSWVEIDTHCSTRMRHKSGSRNVCDSPHFMVVRKEEVYRVGAIEILGITGKQQGS